MPESNVSTVVILLSSCAGVIAMVLLLVLRILSRLSRIERLLERNQVREESSGPHPSLAETSPGGAFEAFLSEDPERRGMTKGEQFTAYRLWRQEKGMNWSNS